MNWFKFHLGDYFSHAAHLSDMEDLCYRRLLDLYYLTERPIPADADATARRIRIETKVVSAVLGEFFRLEADGWHSARCDVEIAKYQRQVKLNQASGHLGGRPKTQQEPASKPNRNQIETKLVPNQIPDTDTKKDMSLRAKTHSAHAKGEENQRLNGHENQTVTKLVPSRFEDFWLVWPSSPRKVGKAACRKKWDTHHLDAIASVILASVESLRASPQWTSGFEPAPLTYLNQRRWEDSAPEIGRRGI